MIQNCQVYININCWSEDRPKIINYLKDYFKDKKNWKIWGQPIASIDIDNDENGFIILDIDIDIQCTYFSGSRATRWDPGEPAYIEGYFDAEDFSDWAKFILPKTFDVSIDIDCNSNIPTEEELIKNFEEYIAEENWYAKY